MRMRREVLQRAASVRLQMSWPSRLPSWRLASLHISLRISNGSVLSAIRELILNIAVVECPRGFGAYSPYD
jgi:hypothetical protein